ncbi:MAG: hypothetical protein NT047_16850 [Deltaproteobacteria bacterium]|nr:hypothetical protein [Deltaproteobacteria bacterium]
MPLTGEQIAFFREAIEGYSFPAVYYDFLKNREVQSSSMADVEHAINGQLCSSHTGDVKKGLANILYWGYANVGYRKKRVEDLNNNITVQQIKTFQALLANDRTPTLTEIKTIHIPQYSGMSFLSKVLMFLNPTYYCVLDRKICRLRTDNSSKALNQLSFGPNEMQIRISSHNEAIYDCWRTECLAVSTAYYGGEYRVVDIERGFFHLIQQGRLLSAQTIYNSA